ncbi:hypothetical protein AWB66_06080 [Caballeronia telluris]|uniref:Uncharacterized protein n=2 Tax=Caballeronia telluris TaxID=326475 RepID=A0A158KF10_9BURK|nr:hypothetical protein AWB66_06080 [Caballeronia telluris]
MKMRRFEELKRFDLRTRNKLRAIFSDGEANAIRRLAHLRGKLGKVEAAALEALLTSSALTKAVRTSTPFPKTSPFFDTLQAHRSTEMSDLLSVVEASAVSHKARLIRLANSLQRIDTLYSERDSKACLDYIVETLKVDGWSHALLRRVILIRENLGPDAVDDRIEKLVRQAGIKSIVVASLIQAYTPDQNILTIKRSILNIADQGTINRYTRTLAKLTVQPFATTIQASQHNSGRVERSAMVVPSSLNQPRGRLTARRSAPT